MSSTGGKTGGSKLGSLALSVDRLAILDSSVPNARKSTLPTPHKDSYAARLAKEHGKVLGTPTHEDSELFQQFIDPAASSVLKLETEQILTTKFSQKQQWETGLIHTKPTAKAPIIPPKQKTADLPAPKMVRAAKTKMPPIPETPKKESKKTIEQGPALKSPTKMVAPRAQPFSEESYVRVKVIVQDIDLNIGHVGVPGSESITWMQRDAIKQYLTIQDIERRREAMEGAVYRTFQHDA
jgi:hypothetical protein